MPKQTRMSAVAVLTWLTVAVLGIALWYLEPNKWFGWALAMFLVPAMWLVLTVIKSPISGLLAKVEGRSRLGEPNVIITGAMIGAGVIMAVSLLAKLLVSTEIIQTQLGEGLSQRALGVIVGVMFTVYGNAVPKMLTPLSAMRCDPATEQRFQRFAGWSFTLMGLAYTAAWLGMPLRHADVASIVVVGTCVAVIVGRGLWMMMAARRTVS